VQKYAWKASTGNVPAAYLTGLLCGLKAKKNGVSEAILDLGLVSPTKGSKVFSTMSGVVDAGVTIPHSPEKIIKERTVGYHIQDYAESLGTAEEYKPKFSTYTAKGLSPEKISEHFVEVRNSILTAYGMPIPKTEARPAKAKKPEQPKPKPAKVEKPEAKKVEVTAKAKPEAKPVAEVEAKKVVPAETKPKAAPQVTAEVKAPAAEAKVKPKAAKAPKAKAAAKKATPAKAKNEAPEEKAEPETKPKRARKKSETEEPTPKPAKKTGGKKE
jgi:hypothetical protein